MKAWWIGWAFMWVLMSACGEARSERKPFLLAGAETRLEYASDPSPTWRVVQDSPKNACVLYHLMDAPASFEESWVSADGLDVVLHSDRFQDHIRLGDPVFTWYHRGKVTRTRIVADFLKDRRCVDDPGEKVDWFKEIYFDEPTASVVVEACDHTATQLSMPDLRLLRQERRVPELNISEQESMTTDFFGRKHGMVEQRDGLGRIANLQFWHHGVNQGTMEKSYHEESRVTCSLERDGQGRLHGKSFCANESGFPLEVRIYRAGVLETIVQGRLGDTRPEGRVRRLDGNLRPLDRWRSWRTDKKGVVHHESWIMTNKGTVLSLNYTLDRLDFGLEPTFSHCLSAVPGYGSLLAIFDKEQGTWTVEESDFEEEVLGAVTQCLNHPDRPNVKTGSPSPPRKVLVRHHALEDLPPFEPCPYLPPVQPK